MRDVIAESAGWRIFRIMERGKKSGLILVFEAGILGGDCRCHTHAHTHTVLER